MARGSWNDRPKMVPEAHKALDNMKYEIASELGLPVKQGSEDYWGYISSRDCGKVGGQMLRRMVHFAESAYQEVSVYMVLLLHKAVLKVLQEVNQNTCKNK